MAAHDPTSVVVSPISNNILLRQIATNSHIPAGWVSREVKGMFAGFSIEVTDMDDGAYAAYRTPVACMFR
jgi:hypothetical protein